MKCASLKSSAYWIKAGVFSVLLSSILVLLAKVNLADPDLWGYLSFGRLFWHMDKFPYRDVFSYVPTLNPWVYHEWLTGVLFYPLYQTVGIPGLLVLRDGLALATLGLVYLTAARRGAHPLAAALFVGIIIKAACYGYSPVRAQVFTFFFFALSLYLLEQARLRGRWRGLYLLPVIHLPWCNLHGGFLAGLGLIAIYAAGEFLARRPYRPYLVVLLLSILATLINPYGVDYWIYMARAVTMPRPDIIEWASLFRAYQTGVANLGLIIYLLVLCFVGLFGMWQSRWREVTASLALAATFFLGLRHIRHLPFFLILAGAYWPVCLQVNVDYLKSRPALKRMWGMANLRIALLAFLASLTVLNLAAFVQDKPLSVQLPQQPSPQKDANPLFYPVGAVAYILQQGLSGKIVTVFGWGEYLMWELYPRCLVGYDGRYETVYPPEVGKKYEEFHYGRPQWRQFLEAYPPDLILLDKRMAVVPLLQKEPHWRQVYADSGCVLFLAGARQSRESP